MVRHKGNDESRNVKLLNSKGKDESQNVKRVKKGGNDDLTGSFCNHVKKGVDHKFLKSLKISDGSSMFNKCQDCKYDKHPVGTQTLKSAVEEEDEMATIWMCLQCGHRGCGENSENKHAKNHMQICRTGLHVLVVSMDDWSVWCHKCYDYVRYTSTGHIAQLVTKIKIRVAELEEESKEQSEAVGNTINKSQKNSKMNVPPVTSTFSKNTKDNGDNEDNLNENGRKRAKWVSVVSVKGLGNLGNTCFFNAVIQNLSQTHMLRQILSKVAVKINLSITPGTFSGLEPIVVQLDQPGSLTQSMCQLIREIQETKERVVCPRVLLNQVCKKAARFKGGKQQDSQELLRYLLDGMRAEETKRLHSAVLEALNKSGQTESVHEYEKNGSYRNFVDEVFGGEITSTVMCRECNTVSSVTETFLDLSLPVADETNGPVLTSAVSKHQQKKNLNVKQKTRFRNFYSNTLKLGEKHKQSDPPNPKVGEHVNNGTREETPVSQSQLAEMGVSEQDEEDPDLAQANGEHEESMEADSHDTSMVCNRFTVSSEDQHPRNGILEDITISKTDQEATGEAEGQMDKLCLDEAFAEGPEVIDVDVERDIPAEPKEYTVVNQDPELAFHTLATRTAPEKQECSVQSCLFQFTEAENLTKTNRLMCAMCTERRADKDNNKVYTDAVKQILISSPPPVLTLHLKRFQQVGQRLSKVYRHVQFPQTLDLAPFCAAKCKNVAEGDGKVLYSLYGIVEHSGSMRSGHYTANVKALPQRPTPSSNGSSIQEDIAPPRESWFYVSDTCVQRIAESSVQGSKAYLLFYERVLQSSGSQNV